MVSWEWNLVGHENKMVSTLKDPREIENKRKKAKKSEVRHCAVANVTDLKEKVEKNASVSDSSCILYKKRVFARSIS